MELYGRLIEVYCEVEPGQGNKWLVTINYFSIIENSSRFYF